MTTTLRGPLLPQSPGVALWGKLEESSWITGPQSPHLKMGLWASLVLAGCDRAPKRATDGKADREYAGLWAGAVYLA